MGASDEVTPHARGLLEVLDRDDHVRQSFAVRAWPFSVGRALDNDVVVSDPNMAAAHFSIGPDADGVLGLTVGATQNGLLLGRRKLHAGDTAVLPLDVDAVDLTAGRTRMRLRLAEHRVAAELALAPATPFTRRAAPMLFAALLLLAGMLFGIWLASDPDGFSRAAGSAVLTGLVGAAVWCGAWALLSKTFTRQAHFGWHLRVFLYAAVALMAVNALPPLLAFAFSWPWISDFAFIGDIAVSAAALYFHLLAVEPARHRVLKWVAVTCAAVGIVLTLWFNVQRTDLLGDELYMNHLFPPALRIARPIATDKFVEGLGPLKAALDKKAKEPAAGDDAGRGDDED
jgi:MFS family permease